MRRVLMFGLVVVACCAAGCAAKVNVDAERDALLAADRGWSETTADAARFVSYLAEDATMYPQGNGAVVGRTAIQEMFSGMTKMPGFSLRWTPSKAVVSAAGDIGYTIGASELTMNDANGRPHVQKGKYLTAWKKLDGQWKVIDDLFNDDSVVPMAAKHVIAEASGLAWGDGPPALPPGAKMAVISGDPASAGPYVLRAQLPAGYRIAPHWHPTDENVTVLSGTFSIGMGDTFDEAALKDLPAGGFAALSAEMRHFATTKAGATIQVHGVGPFALTYVNPSDDPRKKTP